MKKLFGQLKSEQTKRQMLILLGVVLLAALALFVWLWVSRDKAPTPTNIPPIVTLKDPTIELAQFATGLESPTAIVTTQSQSDRRLFVLEQNGEIRVIDAEGKLEARPFLDINQKVSSTGEMGLLGLAFHPGYQDNGFFYINYINKNRETIIARYSVSSDANIADPASEKVLIKLQQPSTNHNGGDLKFGPDGYLYIALGDGGGSGDPGNRAQDNTVLFGKILRIDVNNGDPYSIPETNPLVSVAGAKAEIWASGLRNPWRMSFDKSTGDLYIADVGQGTIEEVNVQRATEKGGANYGWRCFEGNQPFNGSGCQAASAYTAPILEYNHDEGRCSITGGGLYRGAAYPALNGRYFYGDYCNGQLFYAVEIDGKWQANLVTDTPYSISTFGQDSNGEIYLADYATGTIYKVSDTAN